MITRNAFSSQSPRTGAVFISVLMFSACVIGGPPSNRDAIHALDIRRYDEVINVMGIPILERRDIPTLICGTAHLLSGPTESVAPNAPIALYRLGTVTATATTNHEGKFCFSGDFEDGRYLIRSTATTMDGRAEVLVRRDFTEVHLLLESRRPGTGVESGRSDEVSE